MREDNPYSSPSSDPQSDEFVEEYTPKLFEWSGRIGRLRYVTYGFATYLLCSLGIGVLAAVLGGPGSGSTVIISIPILAVGVFMLVAFVVLAKRRLHDFDASTWILVLYFVPVINFFLALALLFMPGTNGPNSYGPKPTKNPGYMWFGLLLPLIMFTGILAAIAIPAYQDYMIRAGQ